MRKKKILLVDDDERILSTFSEIFQIKGYDVTTAGDGAKALQYLREYYFDLVISDLSMPEVNGIQVLKEAKKQNLEISMIMLTGYGDMRSAIEALRLGADDYILKPCNIDELLLRIERCFESSENARKVKLYESLLPVCVYCKNIRDDAGAGPGKGKWMTVEEYIYNKSQVDITHSCCPSCFEKHKDDL